MKKILFFSALFLSAALLSGADLVLKDFSGKKVTGTVKWQKKNNLVIIRGEMQGGEIRLPIGIAQLKQYKYITVDRRHQSGKWEVAWLNKDVREAIKPVNPGDVKLNFPINPKMAVDGKTALFSIYISPGIDLELGSVTFSAKAAKSTKYVQRQAKGPLRVFDTPVGKFTIPATYEDITPAPRRENVKFSVGKNDSGLRSYVVDDVRTLHPKLRPSMEEFNRQVVMFASPGHYEGKTFSVYAVKNAPKTLVSAGAAVSDSGAKLPQPEVRYLRVWPQRKSFVGLQYRDVAEVLERETPKDIPADSALAYYLKVRVPENAKPGVYRGQISFKSGNFPARTLTYIVRVTGLKLVREFKPIIGCYYGGPEQFKFIRDYGLTSALQGHQSCMRDVVKKPMREIMRKTKDVNKRLEMLYQGKDLPQLNFADPRPTGLDNFLKAYNAAGFKSVVCWFAVKGFSDVIADFLNEPISKEPNLFMYPEKLTPAYRKLFKDCIRAINKRAEKFNVRIYWYQFDELGCHGFPKTFKYATEMFKLVKEAGGYTAVTCGEDDFTKMVAPYLDMRIYGISCGNSHKAVNRIRKDTKKYKAGFFSYTGCVYENHYANRYNAGFNMYIGDWEGRYFWNLSSKRNNVWNDFDHSAKDSVMIYPGKNGEIIPTLQLETMRQGIDDFRYLVTVQELVAKALKSKRAEVRAAGKQVQAEMLKLKNEMPFFFSDEWDVRNFDRYRWRVSTMGEYLQALLEGKKVIPEVKFFGSETKKKSKVTFPFILRAPRVSAITVDGNLSDAGWKKAFKVPEIRLLSGNKPEVPTDILIARDDKNLYVAFRNIEPDVSKITRNHKMRDIFTWRDDSVEIFYDGRNDHRSRKHLMFNAVNGVTDIAIDDKADGNIKWNCPGLKSAAKISDGMWCCEVAIPLKEFSSPVVGINFMRNRIALLSHASLVPDPHNAKFYAKLYLEDVPVRLAPAEAPLLGRNIVRAELKEKSQVTISVEGKKQFSAVLEKGVHALGVDLAKEGKNTYAVCVKPLSKNSRSAVWNFTDILPKAMVISPVSAYCFADEGMLTITGKINMNLVKGDGTELAVRMTNADGKGIFSTKARVTGNDLVFKLPLDGVPAEEKYTVEFTLLIKGKAAGKEKRSFYVMKAM
ncbi:MAG: DUF4091 domain-containing protein [Lentisphaeria bacterium]|nr:DUF4091 domain-containing protein [Lentisphaeria bacterium]